MIEVHVNIIWKKQKGQQKTHCCAEDVRFYSKSCLCTVPGTSVQYMHAVFDVFGCSQFAKMPGTGFDAVFAARFEVPYKMF